jgi:hypothetical protein
VLWTNGWAGGVSGDVLGGGVLGTLSAWVMWFAPQVARVRPAGVDQHPGGLLEFQAWIWYYTYMKKATPKKHGGARPGSGRKATGRDPTRTFRLSDEFMASVDGWAALQDDKPTRTEAIRRLVELGLKAKSK